MSQSAENLKPAAARDPLAFARNMLKVAEQAQRFWGEFLSRQNVVGEMMESRHNWHVNEAFGRMIAQLLANPKLLADAQAGWWNDYVKLLQSASQRMLGQEGAPVATPNERDKRFKDAAWQENAVFDFIKQSYLLTARWLLKTMHGVQGLDPQTARKIDFYTRQFVDALSPSNFVLTNPEVLRVTLDTNGENLVQGLSRLIEDLEKGGMRPRISMTDEKAFAIGKNLAVTPGKVVCKNDLMQLIQYAPSTKKVHKTPLLLIPAWINKYYILDLQQDNSFVKWLVDQGYTVFMISWANPDGKLARKTFDDYLKEGPLAALEAIEKATGEKQISAIGYCLGGTLLSVTLSYLTAKKQAGRIKSATFLTSMVDFADAGDLQVFIDEPQLQALEERMSEKGYLEGADMAMSFNMLRANDLIWSFVVNNYLLGKEPFPFDLLYWNNDSTRMPAKMHSFYLRSMYQKNLLAKPGGITVAGVPIHLEKIAQPAYIISTREDHIAPWKSTYAATQLYKGPVRFVLAASGHIAGIVNPPQKHKYSHWTASGHPPKTPDAWLKTAKEKPGSWWTDWIAWHKPFAGGMVNARKPGGGKLKPIENAPGSYVKVRS